MWGFWKTSSEIRFWYVSKHQHHFSTLITWAYTHWPYCTQIVQSALKAQLHGKGNWTEYEFTPEATADSKLSGEKASYLNHPYTRNCTNTHNCTNELCIKYVQGGKSKSWLYTASYLMAWQRVIGNTDPTEQQQLNYLLCPLLCLNSAL